MVMLPSLFQRRSPAAVDPFDWFRREVDRFFEGEGGLTATIYPVDIRETDDRVVVEAELPGFVKDDIDIEVDNDILTIRAERTTPSEEDAKKQGKNYLSERRYARVERRLTLPCAVTGDGVEAKLRDGVLHLEMEKRPEMQRRRIQIKD